LHYARVRYGEVKAGTWKLIKEPVSDEARFWSKVRKTAGCWLWAAGLFSDGYGAFGLKGKTRRAHIVSWEWAHPGEKRGGLCVLHTCDVPSCVKPDHLYLGTHQQNSLDMIIRERQVRGVDVNTAKLVPEQVLEIRRRYAAGVDTQGSLAREYGVSQPTIGAVVHRRSWRHL